MNAFYHFSKLPDTLNDFQTERRKQNSKNLMPKSKKQVQFHSRKIEVIAQDVDSQILP